VWLDIIEDDSHEQTASRVDEGTLRGTTFVTQQEKNIANQIDSYKKNQYQVKYTLWELKN